MANFVITIDGPAASGKSTVAQRLAQKLDAAFLDTGAMYRAVAVAAKDAGVDMADQEELLELMERTVFGFIAPEQVQGPMQAYVDGVDVSDRIRQPEITASARYVASSPKIRAKLIQMQREFAARHKRIVTEGRDQGTVAFPDADTKFYLMATLPERAKRRQAELRAKGCNQSLEQVQQDIERRDKSDEDRAVGPLRPARDAIILDTTDLTVEEVVEKALRCVQEKGHRDHREIENRKSKIENCQFWHLASAVWYWLARWGCQVFCIFFFGFRAYGAKNVPQRGGVILASNHQSFLDPVFCGVALKRRLHFLARDSLFRNRFFALLIHSLNAIPLKRDKLDVSSIKTVIARLQKGSTVCLFPEGTRTSDGSIGEFKPGFGLLCRRAVVPVVPVLIDGAYECWPRHKKIFSPGRITVCYGQAIAAEQATNMTDRELAELVTSRLRQMQNRHRLARRKNLYSD